MTTANIIRKIPPIENSIPAITELVGNYTKVLVFEEIIDKWKRCSGWSKHEARSPISNFALQKGVFKVMCMKILQKAFFYIL